MQLTDILRITRQKAFLTQEEFVNELNVSVSTINRWETGKSRPNLSALKGLKDFCGRHNLPYETIENEWFAHSMEDNQ